jgi:isoquinoline 1-oxidoreductase beta subunit
MTAATITSNRRAFLKGAGAAGVGLVIGLRLDPRRFASRAAAASAVPEFVPNAFVRVSPDNKVTIICKFVEMGQGVMTGVATLVAEELDASPEQIHVQHAPGDVTKYANMIFKMQGTGASTAMADSWDQLRHAGAEARARLVAAAAAEWGVPASEIAVAQGRLKHASGRSASFGDLCERAAAIQLSAQPALKTPDRWVYIGKSFKRVDSKPKTNGQAQFTMDVTLPDMLTCVIARPTRFGASVKACDASAAMAVKGVVETVAVPAGVAVLAKGYWPARKGAEALKIEWDEGGTESRSSATLIAQYTDRVAKPGIVARKEGDAEVALSKAGKVIEATYVFPYLAHAPLEPNDCVIRRTESGVELIHGSELQTLDQIMAGQILGLKPEQVAVTTVLAGGAFGRRGTPHADAAVEAAHVLKDMKHQGPIKVMWSREDDIRGGRYRPAFVHRVRAAIGANGAIAWDHVMAGQSFIFGSPFEQALIKDGLDETMFEGAGDTAYAFKDLRVSVHREEVGVSTLWWRSVGHSHTAYVMETFLDELAAAAGLDELALRRKLLAGSPRHLGVLDLVAERSGWGSPVPGGRARGIAVHKAFGTYVAQVAEVTRSDEGLPKVEKIWCAVDCGQPINPDVIVAQMEGGIGYGLSAALFSAIDLEDGRVVQANFDTYRVLRIHEMPQVEVHIVPSSERPTGVGEPGVAPLAPAVANGWAKLTGQRVRQLPFVRGVGTS